MYQTEQFMEYAKNYLEMQGEKNEVDEAIKEVRQISQYDKDKAEETAIESSVFEKIKLATQFNIEPDDLEKFRKVTQLSIDPSIMERWKSLGQLNIDPSIYEQYKKATKYSIDPSTLETIKLAIQNMDNSSRKRLNSGYSTI